MTLLDAALAEVVKEKIASLQRDLDRFGDTYYRVRQNDDGLGWLAAGNWRLRYKHQLQSEIQFLTDLHLALTNTMKKPAENPNSALQAEPAP